MTYRLRNLHTGLISKHGYWKSKAKAQAAANSQPNTWEVVKVAA